MFPPLRALVPAAWGRRRRCRLCLGRAGRRKGRETARPRRKDAPGPRRSRKNRTLQRVPQSAGERNEVIKAKNEEA